ncbi:ORF58 [Ranid herpesvirus 1]|uniref:ORF58 n=1 Tax=Ranid herpesvirus 1 TaxID=85655 RepID=Q14VQ0_9VIRU|nr:ORF58 [Ranid herpesvirus 1]ABG25716.1 ORF58 [Ranid herpesvirus 1]
MAGATSGSAFFMVQDYDALKLNADTSPLLPVLKTQTTPLHGISVIVGGQRRVFTVYTEHLPYVGTPPDSTLGRAEALAEFARYTQLWLEQEGANEDVCFLETGADPQAPWVVQWSADNAQAFCQVLELWGPVARHTNISHKYSVEVENDCCDDVVGFLRGELLLPPQLLDRACRAYVAVLHALRVDLEWELMQGYWYMAVMPGLSERVNQRIFKPLYVPALVESRHTVAGKVQIRSVLELKLFTGYEASYSRPTINILDGVLLPLAHLLIPHIALMDRHTPEFTDTLEAVTRGRWEHLGQPEKDALLFAATYHFAVICQTFIACNRTVPILCEHLRCMNDTAEKDADHKISILSTFLRNRIRKDCMHLVNHTFGRPTHLQTSVVSVLLPVLKYSTSGEEKKPYGAVVLKELKGEKPRFLTIQYLRQDNPPFRALMQHVGMNPDISLHGLSADKADYGSLRILGHWATYNLMEHVEVGNVKMDRDGGALGQHMQVDLWGPNNQPNMSPGARYTIKINPATHGPCGYAAMCKTVLVSLYSSVLVAAIYGDPPTRVTEHTAPILAMGISPAALTSIAMHFFAAFGANKLFMGITPMGDVDPKSNTLLTDSQFELDLVQCRGKMFRPSEYNTTTAGFTWIREHGAFKTSQAQMHPIVYDLLANVNMKLVVSEFLAENKYQYLRPAFLNLAGVNIPAINTLITQDYRKAPVSLERSLTYFHCATMDVSKHAMNTEFRNKYYKVKLEPNTECYNESMYKFRRGGDDTEVGDTTATTITNIIKLYEMMEQTVVPISAINSNALSESLFKLCIKLMEQKNFTIIHDVEPIYATEKSRKRRAYSAHNSSDEEQYDDDEEEEVVPASKKKWGYGPVPIVEDNDDA